MSGGWIYNKFFLIFFPPCLKFKGNRTPIKELVEKNSNHNGIIQKAQSYTSIFLFVHTRFKNLFVNVIRNKPFLQLFFRKVLLFFLNPFLCLKFICFNQIFYLGETFIFSAFFPCTMLIYVVSWWLKGSEMRAETFITFIVFGWLRQVK